METGWHAKNPCDARGTKFLVFDCLLYNGTSCIHQTLPTRLQNGHNAVNSMVRNDNLLANAVERKFKFELKEMQPSCELQYFSEKFLAGLLHPNDGLIFTPVYLPYICGTNKALLKWKARDCTTIDFRVLIDDPVNKVTRTPTLPPSLSSPLSWKRETPTIDRAQAALLLMLKSLCLLN
ncbi:mRNA capping enzyme, catalytic domain-containing protein [Xylogone sp. PMI_703]|nr:mRNA capping enzyme, catalytic domain-containing protein [Xylogone sp. PMI_703]